METWYPGEYQRLYVGPHDAVGMVLDGELMGTGELAFWAFDCLASARYGKSTNAIQFATHGRRMEEASSYAHYKDFRNPSLSEILSAPTMLGDVQLPTMSINVKGFFPLFRNHARRVDEFFETMTSLLKTNQATYKTDGHFRRHTSTYIRPTHTPRSVPIARPPSGHLRRRARMYVCPTYTR